MGRWAYEQGSLDLFVIPIAIVITPEVALLA